MGPNACNDCSLRSDSPSGEQEAKRSGPARLADTKLISVGPDTDDIRS